MKSKLETALLKMECEHIMDALPTIQSVSLQHDTLLCETKHETKVALTLTKNSKSIEEQIKKQSKYIVSPFRLYHMHLSRNYVFRARIINPNTHYHKRSFYGKTVINALCNALDDYDEFLAYMLKEPTDDYLPF